MLQQQRSEPTRLETKSCKECGAPYLMTRPNKKYCSVGCQRKVSRRRLQETGINTEYECNQCGAAYRPKRHDRITYCSRECAFEAKRQSARRNNILKWIKRIEPNKAAFCEVCNVAFIAHSSQHKLCSDECRKAVTATRYEDKGKVYYFNKFIERAKEHSCLSKCAECGVVFTNIVGGGLKKKYCTQDCCSKHGRRIAKAKRRAAERNLPRDNVDPFKIFRQAKWACQSCGTDTPKKLRGTYEDNAPELDHIYPLSKGGTHTYDNVQLLCRKCNLDKSDKVLEA